MDRYELDEELVRAARRGDNVAFAALLSRHRPLLLTVCRHALHDDDLAEDAAQEASLQAFLNLDQLRRPESFGSWLAGIGLNVCHRWRRKRLRDVWSWEAMLGGQLLAKPVDTSPGPEQLAETAELRAWVQQVIASLPPGQRAAVTLHYLAGLTQAETASLLDIEVGAVKTRLHKARVTLRGKFGGELWAGALRQEGQAMVEMALVDVRRRRKAEGTTSRHIVILEEVGGNRRLTIWIGEFEATALALHLEGASNPRPLTCAFAAKLPEAADGRLREVRIDRLEGDIFYASAVVDGPAGERAVDARPSDALNLALLLSAPIRVSSDVLVATCGVRNGVDWTKLNELSEGSEVIAAEVMAEWSQSGK
jgi:RNA polymerase sigma factor (sigma-70 family)